MKKIIDLSYAELLEVEGGCAKCHSSGKDIGKALRDNIIVNTVTEAASSAWDTVKGWFN